MAFEKDILRDLVLSCECYYQHPTTSQCSANHL